jgi:hypothetical protein
MYEKGEGTTMDKTKALYWYENAAQKNDNEAQVRCGTMYYQGIGTEKDLDKAVAWLRKADFAGLNPKAEELLREILQSKQVGENRSRPTETAGQAALDAKKTEERKKTVEQENEQELLKKGKDLYGDKHYDEAFRILEPLAEQGNKDAQILCAVRYDFGQGITKDPAKAFYWHKKSAEQGYSSSQFAIACDYKSGTGTERDLVKALYWFEKVAEQGDEMAAEEVKRLSATLNQQSQTS